MNTAKKLLYIPCMVIIGYYGIKKVSFTTSIFELHRVKNCISSLCINRLGDPPPRTRAPNTQVRWKT